MILETEATLVQFNFFIDLEFVYKTYLMHCLGTADDHRSTFKFANIQCRPESTGGNSEGGRQFFDSFLIAMDTKY